MMLLWSETQKRRMRFSCENTSEGLKPITVKTSHTAFALSVPHPTAQATGNERCPIKIYKEFARHWPEEMNQPDSPFYLAVKHQRKPEITMLKIPTTVIASFLYRLLCRSVVENDYPRVVLNRYEVFEPQ